MNLINDDKRVKHKFQIATIYPHDSVNFIIELTTLNLHVN